MRIKELINQEIRISFSDIPHYDDASDAILAVVRKTEKQFVFIIDEWDAIIREAKNDTETQKAYLDLLREWFKNGNFTSEAVAAAYMTGILPIKKDKSQLEENQKVPTRKFLLVNIMPTLTKGLLEVCKINPIDPIDYLADFLFTNSTGEK